MASIKSPVTFCILFFSASAVWAQDPREGIGTKSPLARLHVADSNVLFSGPASVADQTSYFPPVQGPGTRLMWYPQKAAFRSGYISQKQWDKDSIGNFSVALGSDNTANGKYSFAAGFNNRAAGEGSMVLGTDNRAFSQDAISIGKRNWASGQGAIAIGYMCSATYYFSTAFGYNTLSANEGSTAMGYHSSATGQFSTATGYYTQAAGISSLATGFGTTASGANATSLGQGTLASGINSTVMGMGNIARYQNSLVIGIFNDTLSARYPVGRLLEVGNGTSERARANALTILEDGRVGIGTSNPTQRLEVMGGICAYGPVTMCSDNRLKTGITSLGNPLPALLSLQGIYYYWNRSEFPALSFNERRQVGVSAQELEKIFPELVETDQTGIKSVDYARLTPVLLEAIKEQQHEIELLKERVRRIEEKLK